MSVRRLAEDQFQPAAFAFNDENAVWADKTIQKYPAGRQQSAVIPLLMRAQEQDGWVTRAAIEKVRDGTFKRMPTVLHVEDDEDVLKVISAGLGDDIAITFARNVQQARFELQQ